MIPGGNQQEARIQARPCGPVASCSELPFLPSGVRCHQPDSLHKRTRALYVDRAVGPAEVSLHQGSPLTGQLKVCPFLAFLTFLFEIPAPQPGSVRPALRNPHNIVGEGRAIGAGVGSHAVQVSPSWAPSGLIMRRGLCV